MFDGQNGFCPSQYLSKIKGAARQCYGDGEGVAQCERTLSETYGLVKQLK